MSTELNQDPSASVDTHVIEEVTPLTPEQEAVLAEELDGDVVAAPEVEVVAEPNPNAPKNPNYTSTYYTVS
jgi:hypothetical protein